MEQNRLAGPANACFRSEGALERDGFTVCLQESKMSFLSHWHNAVEVLLGISGKVAVGVGGRFWELGEGDIVIIGSQVSHCLSDLSLESRRLALLFQPNLLFGNPLLEPYQKLFQGTGSHSSVWEESTRCKMEEVLLKLYEEYAARAVGWEALSLSRMTELVYLTAAGVPRQTVIPAEGGGSVTLRVMEYLSAHYREDVTLELCARALGFNSCYLSGKFKEQLGVPFHQYLQNLRLNHAESLLRDTDLPVGAVAERSGFASDKTFYRVFREKNASSPQEYRRHWHSRT